MMDRVGCTGHSWLAAGATRGRSLRPIHLRQPPVFEAHSKRNELFAGAPTVEAIWGNKIAAPLLDNYLARAGFNSSPNRKDNLFEPVPGDHGAHGRLDEAVDGSAELWVSTRNKQPGLAALGAAGAVGAGLFFAAHRRTAEAGA